MPQLKPKEVKTLCCDQLRKLFNGEITKEELSLSLRELETRISASEENKAPGLFDDYPPPEGK